MTKIGFIGLGVMGLPMARHLLAAGHEVRVSERSAAIDPARSAGAIACASTAAVPSGSEIAILMVPDTPQVVDVLFGPDGIAEALAADSLLIDMSSISPLATKAFAERLAQTGVDYLDAPVSGGEVGAKAATLTIMAGGSDDAFARARPLLETLGKNITHVGPVGSGQTAKVANQIIVALNIAAVGEALLFAEKAGADPAKVREALLGGFASSRVLEVHGERMIKRSFDPGFRIELHSKDLALALDGGRAMGVPLPQTAYCQQLFSAAIGRGDGGRDHSALVTVQERLAGVALQDRSAPPMLWWGMKHA